jgi:hypothetical protein
MSAPDTIGRLQFPFHEVRGDHISTTTLSHQSLGVSPITFGPESGKIEIWTVKDHDWSSKDCLAVIDVDQAHALAGLLIQVAKRIEDAKEKGVVL